jgi:hypothetical protein
MKLVRLFKTCLNGIYSKVSVGKYLLDALPIQNGLEQGNDLWTLLSNFALEYAFKGTGIEWDKSATVVILLG